MPQFYNYTIYRTDGSVQAFTPNEPMHPDDIESLIGGYFSILPPDFYAHMKLGNKTTVYVVEAELREELDPNPHFVELNGNVLVEKVTQQNESAHNGVE